MAKRYVPFDLKTAFAPTAITITASDVIPAGQEGGFKVGKGREDMWLVIDVSAIDVASADELYSFVLQGGVVADFSSGAKETFAIVQLGATAVRLGGSQASPVGRYVTNIANEIGQQFKDFEFVRLNVIISGTTPSITFKAWLSKHPDA